jgi:hypothetical protein
MTVVPHIMQTQEDKYFINSYLIIGSDAVDLCNFQHVHTFNSVIWEKQQRIKSLSVATNHSKRNATKHYHNMSCCTTSVNAICKSLLNWKVMKVSRSQWSLFWIVIIVTSVWTLQFSVRNTEALVSHNLSGGISITVHKKLICCISNLSKIWLYL